MADTGRKPETVEGVADKGKVAFAREQRKEPTRGEEWGIRTLRFSESDVRERLRRILSRIRETLEESGPG